ncbi:hypothetical protein D3C86_1810520 [compost metagenome]
MLGGLAGIDCGVDLASPVIDGRELVFPTLVTLDGREVLHVDVHHLPGQLPLVADRADTGIHAQPVEPMANQDAVNTVGTDFALEARELGQIGRALGLSLPGGDHQGLELIRGTSG